MSEAAHHVTGRDAGKLDRGGISGRVSARAGLTIPRPAVKVHLFGGRGTFTALRATLTQSSCPLALAFAGQLKTANKFNVLQRRFGRIAFRVTNNVIVEKDR